MLPTRLVVPRFNLDAFRDAREDAEGAGRELLQREIQAISLLDGVTSENANAERIAWLCLWTRSFVALEATRGALTRNSGYGMTLVGRAVTEATWHIHAIVEPITNNDSDAWARAIDNLRAFLAWALWNDSKTWEALLEPGRLEDVWDSASTRVLISDPKTLAMEESLMGPVEILNDHELELEREAQRRGAEDALGRCRNWLDSAALAPWRDRIQSLNRDHPSFFQVLDRKQRHNFDRLAAIGLEFAYPAFMAQSASVHGSGLDQFLLTTASLAAVRFPTAPEDAEREARWIGSGCTRQLVALLALQERLWP